MATKSLAPVDSFGEPLVAGFTRYWGGLDPSAIAQVLVAGQAVAFTVGANSLILDKPLDVNAQVTADFTDLADWKAQWQAATTASDKLQVLAKRAKLA